MGRERVRRVPPKGATNRPTAGLIGTYRVGIVWSRGTYPPIHPMHPSIHPSKSVPRVARLGASFALKSSWSSPAMTCLGCGESMKSLGCGECMECLGCGESMKSLGCGESMKSLGCGACMECLGCGESMKSLGGGESMQSLGCGECMISGSVSNADEFRHTARLRHERRRRREALFSACRHSQHRAFCWPRAICI